MSEISMFIIRHNTEAIHRKLKEMNCDHSWEIIGFGYKCNKCSYYTGQNSPLNELIKEHLMSTVKPRKKIKR
jgi:hypothetical protein